MSYLNNWHRDYAAESIKGYELNRWSKDSDKAWAEYAVECGQVAQLAAEVGREIGNNRIVSIAETVLNTIATSASGGSRKTRSYRTITSAQRHTLAVALLEKYISARGIAAVVWHLTDEEIDNADA